MSKGQRWLSIEGSIGAGKSVLHNALIRHLKGRAARVDEPVQKWCDSGILQLSYANPAVWNFPAQTHFFTSRIDAFCEQYDSNPNSEWFVSERSPFSDKMFWETQLALNRVDERLGPLYLDMWTKWQQLLPISSPSLFVYVNTDADTCTERMRLRNRTEESNVSHEYMDELQRIHDATFLDPLGVEMPDGTRVPVLVVQGALDFRNQQVIAQICRQITEAMGVVAH